MSCTPDYQSNQLRPLALEIRFTQMNFCDFVAVHESVRGPEPKYALAVGMSAFGVRPD